MTNVKSIRKQSYAGCDPDFKVTLTNGGVVLMDVESAKVAKALIAKSKAHQLKIESTFNMVESRRNYNRTSQLPTTESNSYIRSAFVTSVKLLIERMLKSGYSLEESIDLGNGIIDGKVNLMMYAHVDHDVIREIKGYQSKLS